MIESLSNVITIFIYVIYQGSHISTRGLRLIERRKRRRKKRSRRIQTITSLRAKRNFLPLTLILTPGRRPKTNRKISQPRPTGPSPTAPPVTPYPHPRAVITTKLRRAKSCPSSHFGRVKSFPRPSPRMNLRRPSLPIRLTPPPPPPHLTQRLPQ